MAGENDPVPLTMRAYRFQGTPSTVLIDRDGAIAYQGFGQEDDIALGLRLGMLLSQASVVEPDV
jgi:hypothetical protein